MEAWKTIYTDEQREVLRHTYFTVGLTNMAQLGRLARAGELQFEGKPYPAFEIPDASVRDIINKEKRRRQGKEHSKLVAAPPGDAVETLRRRLVSLLDHETARLERDVREKPRTAVDAEQIRKLARATRELHALPGPGERSKVPAPGRGRAQGNGESPAKANTMAGSLMAALQPGAISTQPEAARDDVHLAQDVEGEETPPTTGITDHTNPASHHDSEDANAATPNQHHDDSARHDEDPGSYARSELAGLRAESVSVGPA